MCKMQNNYYYYCLKRLENFEPETKTVFCSECMQLGHCGYADMEACQNKNLEVIYNNGEDY